MKTLTYIASFTLIVLCFALYKKLGGWGASTIIGACLAVGFYVYHSLRVYFEDRKNKRRYEDLFVITRHPRTGETFELGNGLDELVVWSSYRSAKKECARQLDLLKRSGNKHVDDNLKGFARLAVEAIIFQDGEYINETWEEDFPDRCRDIIRARRKGRHAHIRNTDPDFYHKFINLQIGVMWEGS